jgi:thiamine biosynthesis lipoprotein
MRVAVATPLLAAAALLPAAAAVVEDGRYAMGTVLELTLEVDDPSSGAALLGRCFERVAELERRATRFDAESELEALNRRAGTGPVPLSSDLAGLLDRALAYRKLTRGTFDVTVGPLVELWTEAARRGALPSPDSLAAARARVGEGRVRLGPGPSATLPQTGSAVDLGGIAKGYALDVLEGLLRGAAVERALASFGRSSLQAIGAPAGGAGWRVLLRGPDESPLGTLTLVDSALSVSSSFGQWSEIEGRRYGHVIDPRTGQPLTAAAEAVVVTREGALAEALSKALLILGPEGIPLLESLPDVEGLLIEESGALRATRGFSARVAFELAPSYRAPLLGGVSGGEAALPARRATSNAP